MAEQPTDDAAPDDEASAEEIIYGDGPIELTEEQIAHQQAIQRAYQPTEEFYEPFDPVAPAAPQATNEVNETISARDQPLQFDPRFKEPFDGLLFVGVLQKRFTWMGHEFVIRTVDTNSTLEIGLLTQPYVGTETQMKAYQAACVAASWATLDRQPLPIPLTNEMDDTQMLARFQFVLRYNPIVVDMLYGQLMQLEIKVDEVLAAMGKA